MAGTHRWPSKGSQTQVHSPCTEAGWGAGLGRGFLQGLAPLPLLPFNTWYKYKPQSRPQAPEPVEMMTLTRIADLE